ncbi:MAG: hypothetical protein N2C12_18630 [Planctomycetales bacterium]
MSTDRNENWGECANCGSPVLINPDTGEAEACGKCVAEASPRGLQAGALSILLGVLVFGAVVYFCFRILLN